MVAMAKIIVSFIRHLRGECNLFCNTFKFCCKVENLYIHIALYVCKFRVVVNFHIEEVRLTVYFYKKFVYVGIL